MDFELSELVAITKSNAAPICINERLVDLSAINQDIKTLNGLMNLED